MWKEGHQLARSSVRSHGRARFHSTALLCAAIASIGAIVPLVPACRVRRLGVERADASSSAATLPASAAIASSSQPVVSSSLPSGLASAVPASAATDAGSQLQPAVVAVLGIGSEPEDIEAVTSAVHVALQAMSSRQEVALDAAVEGMVVIEGSTAFLEAARGEADAGELLRDAAVGGPGCWFAGVTALEHVRTPVRAARALCGAPQPILAGDGALSWARALGLAEDDAPAFESGAPVSSASASASTRTGAGAVDASIPEWTPWKWLVGDPRLDGGTDAPRTDAGGAKARRSPAGPAAVVVRDSSGALAGAMSGASSDFGMPGRVGGLVLPGAALFVGDAGAVAISGYAEELARTGLARAVHGRLALHHSAADAADWALAQVADSAEMGIIVLGSDDFAVRSTTEMGWAAQVGTATFSSASKPARATGGISSKGGGP